MATKGSVTSRSDKLNVVPLSERVADETAKFLSKWPTRCLNHEDVVTCYCMDHDTLLCDTCSISNHKSCGNVLSLQEASKGIRSSRECSSIENAIKKLIQDYEKLHKEQSDILTNVLDQEKDFIKAVKDFRREINAALDRLEHVVLAKKDDYASKRKDVVKGM